MFSRLVKCTLLIAALFCRPAGAAMLIFQPHVEVREACIHLQDIARVEDAGEWTVQLMQTDLGKAPMVGRTERLKAERVAEWVRSRFPQLTSIEWKGAGELVIRTATRTVPADLLAAKAQEGLAGLPVGREQWHLLRGRSLPDLVVPDISHELVVGAVRTTNRCERAMVQIDAVANGRILGSSAVWFKNEGPALRPSLENSGAESFESLNKKRCGRLLAGGSIKQPASESTPEVTRMDRVTVEMHSPILSIETTGIALGSGKVGEMVRIKRPGAADSFLAEVSGRGRVRITEGVQR